MIHDIKPLSKAKKPVTIDLTEPWALALKRYAHESKQHQYQVVESGLLLTPGFSEVLSQEQEAYANKVQNHEHKVNSTVEAIRSDIDT